MSQPPFRELISSALRFWEPARILYNAVLFAIVAGYCVAAWPLSRSMLSLDLVLGLFLGAVLANAAYCAAYPLDIFVQLSGYREQWLRLRWVIFLLGLAFAGVITRFIAIGMFTPLTS
jgi:hypothetical protein